MIDRLVVDSGITIKWYVDEPHIAEARRIRDAYLDGKLLLLAPEFIYAEIGSIVWKKQRQQDITAGDAVAILADIRTFQITVTPTLELLDEAFRLATTHGRTVYDCLYIALSLRENCPFVTADERLVNAVSGVLPNVIWIGNWP